VNKDFHLCRDTDAGRGLHLW